MMLHLAGIAKSSALRRVVGNNAVIRQCNVRAGCVQHWSSLSSSGSSAIRGVGSAARNVGNRILHSNAARLVTTLTAVSSVGLFAAQTADCQAVALSAPQDHFSNAVAASQLKQQTLIHQIKKQLEYYWLLLTRWFTLLFTYSPAVVSSPVLLYGDEKAVQQWWDLFKQCILSSGPCSIKFAQWISTRPDLFPKEICQQFQHLQSNKVVPPWSSIEPVLRRDYGEHWMNLLNLEYDVQTKQPVVIGGGCVAQVLKGRVKVLSNPHDIHSPPIEKEVAIKITHPGVKQSIVADIELMRTISSTLEYWIPSIKQVSLCDSVEEFAKIMIEQVDMVFEARALDTFRQNFNKMDSSTKFMNMIMHQSTGYNVIFPEPIFEYTTEDVLVETYEEGVLIRDYIKVCAEKEKKLIAKIGLDAIFKMIFLDNFIHAGEEDYIITFISLLLTFIPDFYSLNW